MGVVRLISIEFTKTVAVQMNTVAKKCTLFVNRLFPICWSITGDEFRDSLAILLEYVPEEVGRVETRQTSPRSFATS
jgi:aminopeptidase-like protein